VNQEGIQRAGQPPGMGNAWNGKSTESSSHSGQRCKWKILASNSQSQSQPSEQK